MIVVLRVGVEARHHGTQTIVTAQLRIDQRDQMIPALETLVVGISVHTIHSSLKLPPIDRFKEPAKNAIAKPHARSPSESRQPESTSFTPVKPGMHRDTVNHSPDSPAFLREEGWVRGCFRDNGGSWTRGDSPSPGICCANSGLSPQAGRGEESSGTQLSLMSHTPSLRQAAAPSRRGG